MRFPVWRRRREEELEKEMRSHLEMSIEDRIASGESAELAAMGARRQFGNDLHIKEITRDMWGWRWLERLAQDLRYGLRMLLAKPGFSIVAIATLALGIGANSAIFSFVNSILLDPLGLKDSDRLVEIWESNPQRGIYREGPSGPTFLDWQEQAKSFEDMALFELGSGTFTGRGEPAQIPAMRVTTNFLTILGAKTDLGRLFLPVEASGSRNNIVIISNSLWQRRYGSDPNIIGKTTDIDGLAYTIVGTLTPTFRFPVAAEAFVPWPTDELRQKNRQDHDFGVCGHLKPGIDVQQANAELNTISRRLAQNFRVMENWGATVVPMQQVMVEYIRPALLVLLAAVAFVLLIACTNIATLLVARGAGRQREIAIRAALGASRWRLVRQFLTESLLLGLAGGSLGLLVAVWCTHILTGIVPQQIPIPDAHANAILPNVNINARVLWFTLLVSLLTSIIFGSVPALALSTTNPGDAMRDGSKGSAGRHHRLSSLLVVTEVSLAIVLLVGAGLVIRSFWRLGQVNPGFQPDHLLTAEMELPTDSKYKEGSAQSAVFERFLERVDTLPGVRSAALTSIVPLTQYADRAQFIADGNASIPQNQTASVEFRAVSANYFKTLMVSLMKGRDFTNGDKSDAPSVVIIDESLARAYWPNANPIGQHIKFSPQGRLREIIGIVGAVKQEGLDQAAKPTIYAPFLQIPVGRMSLVIRSVTLPDTLTNDVRSAIWAVDKDQPVYNIKSMDEIISETKSTPRLSLILLGAFASLALALASLGIYGVISYSVTRRTHEIGIRMALGAQARDVLKLVVGHGMILTVIGVAVGLAASLALTRTMTTLLYGVSATDPTTFAIVALTLLSVALMASYIPARRAARTNPLICLRSE